MADTPEAISGELHLIVTTIALPGKAAELLTLFKAVEKNAKTAEPGCKQYDVLKFGDEFCIVEHYVNQAALEEHWLSEPFKVLAARRPELAKARVAHFYEST